MRRALVAGHVCVDLIPSSGAAPQRSRGTRADRPARHVGGRVRVEHRRRVGRLDVPVQVRGTRATTSSAARWYGCWSPGRGNGSDPAASGRIDVLHDRRSAARVGPLVLAPRRRECRVRRCGGRRARRGPAPCRLPAAPARPGRRRRSAAGHPPGARSHRRPHHVARPRGARPTLADRRRLAGPVRRCSRTSTSSRPASTTSARRSIPAIQGGRTGWAGAPGGSSTWAPRSRWSPAAVPVLTSAPLTRHASTRPARCSPGRAPSGTDGAIAIRRSLHPRSRCGPRSVPATPPQPDSSSGCRPRRIPTGPSSSRCGRPADGSPGQRSPPTRYGEGDLMATMSGSRPAGQQHRRARHGGRAGTRPRARSSCR